MKSEVPEGNPFVLFLPLVVLAALTSGLFFVLVRILPQLPSTPLPTDSLPSIVKIVPFLEKHPFPASLGLLSIGGLAFLLGPRNDPLRITAWYLAGAFFLGLWLTILILIPQTSSYIETGPQ